jgi:hypothetical protein
MICKGWLLSGSQPFCFLGQIARNLGRVNTTILVKYWIKGNCKAG